MEITNKIHSHSTQNKKKEYGRSNGEEKEYIHKVYIHRVKENAKALNTYNKKKEKKELREDSMKLDCLLK